MRKNVIIHATAMWTLGAALVFADHVHHTRECASGEGAAMLGTVRDRSLVPRCRGVTVEARHLGTGVSQSVVTNGQGRFNLPDLALGEYEVQASIAGFQTVVHKGLTLAVGSQNVVDFTLPIGTVAETIAVTGESPMCRHDISRVPRRRSRKSRSRSCR